MPRPKGSEPPKDPTGADRAARWYARNKKVTPKGYCTICNGPMKGAWSLLFGFHQKCDPALYQKLWREAKKKSGK